MKVNNLNIDDKKLVNGYYFPIDTDKNWLKNVIKEIWEDNEYERFGVEIKKGDTVLDLGAYVGVFSNYAISKKAHHVYAFESTKHYYECLLLNTITTPKITNIRGVISDRSDEYYDDTKNYNFNKIFKEFNLGKVDFCKMDIEGFEYPLLINSNINEIQKINQFAIEVHNIYAHHKIYEIIEMFSKCDYTVNFEIIHKDWNLGMIYAKNKNI